LLDFQFLDFDQPYFHHFDGPSDETWASSHGRRNHETDDGEGGNDKDGDSDDKNTNYQGEKEEDADANSKSDSGADEGGDHGSKTPESRSEGQGSDGASDRERPPASGSVIPPASSMIQAGDSSKKTGTIEDNAALCSTVSCRLGATMGSHVILSSLLLTAFAVLCYWRLRIRCSLRRGRLDQGEYRMVAAQYVDSAFDESLSDGGDDEDGSYDDDIKDDGGWSTREKKSIEMHEIDREANGGLTLEEMNG
jgi:hypothetical protein